MCFCYIYSGVIYPMNNLKLINVNCCYCNLFIHCFSEVHIQIVIYGMSDNFITRFVCVSPMPGRVHEAIMCGLCGNIVLVGAV